MKNNFDQLTFKVSYEQHPKEEISLIGFLFLCDGLLLDKQFVREGVLEFKNANYQTSELRLFIAPAMDKKIEKVSSIEELAAYKPYEPVLRSEAEGRISILPIPANISIFWPLCFCRVTGKVSKWFHVGYTWQDRAVCRARVHICEIDPIWYWIYQIPDFIIAKIPEAILNPAEVIKLPNPIPDPPPFAEKNMQVFAQAQTKSLFKTFSAEDKQIQSTANLPEISAEIKQNLSSTNLNLVRETIAKNYAILHPWFCYWPWWWSYFYRCTERAVVYTDANGRFDTNIAYWCFGDKPDVYIWVEYLINGVWTTVYNPPVPCNTLWDYVCGTNINIQVTDPRVPGDCCCNCPIPGELVWVRTVGSTSVAHINQQSFSQAPPNQNITYERIGLTDASAIYDPSFLPTTVGDYKRPFGGSPYLYMGFGSDLPNAGIYYYRWSYKQVARAVNGALINVADSYKPVDPTGGSVYKGYEFTYIDSNGDTQFGANSVKLGPFTVGTNDNLYIIPPVQPTMAPFSVPETAPLWHEQTYNMNTMNFDSSALKNGMANGGDGLYEFKLELFDQAGNLLTNIPKDTFKIPDYNNANFSVNAPDILLENPTLFAATAFNMLMRVDNSHCNADIFTVNVNGLPASTDCCGFVSYKPNGVEADLDLSFLATHVNNFAVFNFAVARGTCGDVPVADASGMVIDDANGYVLSAGIYDKHFAPIQLLDTCYNNGTGKAAFAENLYVAAMATDGTFRLIAKDASDVAAFALEP
jgi:hypothetical protein